MTSKDIEPIFIHSLFRSGSTFLYHAIKRTGRFYIYHEPFHEIIGRLPIEWNDFISRTKQLKELLRHDFLDSNYFDEYAPLLPVLEKHFDPKVSFHLFFLNEDDDAQILKIYIDCLIDGSRGKPVLQCTRTVGRLRWLKRNYDSNHLFLLRNPWDQWFSYKVDPYIASTPQIIYSQPRLPEVLRDVLLAAEFTPLQGNNVAQMRDYCFSHPVAPKLDYSLFFGLWLYSFLEGTAECDLVLDMDKLSRDETKRVEGEVSLAKIGLDKIDLSDCKVHRTTFKSNEVGFYQHIEEQLLEIFKRNGYSEIVIEAAQDYLLRERKISFVGAEATDGNFSSILEDASRLRTMLISNGQDLTQLFSQLNQTVGDLKTELAVKEDKLELLSSELTVKEDKLELLSSELTAKEDVLQSLREQFNRITVSRTWKVALLLRRARALIAPPNSLRARVLRWLTNVIVSPILLARTKMKLNEEIALIRASDLFDTAWYLKNNPDVAQSKADPVLHFLQNGGFEGRDPGPQFSSNWYLKNYEEVAQARINPLVHYLKYGKNEGRLAMPDLQKYTARTNNSQTERAANSASDELTIFTIASKNFTAYAKTLFDSVSQYHPNAVKFLFLCDEMDPTYDISSFPFEVVPLSELNIPDIEEMSQRYNITEFNTAIKPYAFSYLFRRLGKEKIIYLDPDILLLSPLQEVIDEFDKGIECVLTPHILEPAEHVEMSDNKFLQYGIYNLGFLGLRKTADSLRIVDWWARQLVDGCVINLSEGLFVDQKWADLFPAFLKRVSILHHPGYNVAYWNLSQRKVELIDGHWYSNQQPLRFVHFSGNRLDDPYFLSHHSGVYTRDNIGDLNYLLKLYRDILFANGHAEYSRIPYSFSWHGASGINLHTPKPYVHPSSIPNDSNPNLHETTANNLSSETHNLASPFIRLRSYWRLFRAALTMAGGWSTLIIKGFRAFKQGGFTAIRHRIHIVNTYAEVMHGIVQAKPAGNSSTALALNWMPRILIIDASTPRPDRDAGSLSTFNLIKIYLDLGYDVTFIPSDLLYLGEYTEALRELGVRCFYRPEINSVKDHLEKVGREYNFIVLCRAPIAALYIADIRQRMPRAKIIFDTIDLHYLRDQREAELDGSREKIEAAANAKRWELDIIRQCDVSIVLSSVEKEILRNEVVDADVRLIPLIFVDNAYDIPPFEERKDFLFIGGFPHLPNVDAVIYFCQEVLPLIRKNIPDIKFHIVGNDPPPEVIALGNDPGVIVHGYVKDITSIFRRCRLSVAPLRYGAGIKGKIATSMANGVPVIASGIAIEGMEIEPGKHVLIADNSQEFADLFIRAYRTKELWGQLSANGRQQAYQFYSYAAGYKRISSLMQDINPVHKQIDLYTLRSFNEYDLLRKTISEDVSKRKAVELNLIKHDQSSFLTKGFCFICGCESMFNTSFMYSYETTSDGKMIPNWCEHLDCTQCGFTNRIRAAMHIFYQKMKPSSTSSIYITEQTTPLFRWLKSRHTKLVGSEYFGDAVPFGAEKDGLRNEDLTALTFPDDSFDFILSFDVMEHVDDDIAALKEVYRCLKPGGTFLFSAPFLKDRTQKLIRARMLADGSIEHILPPEYHSNPVDHEHGALCFRYFAWDLLEDMKRIGFEDPRILDYWSRDFAYLGVEQFMFIGIKPVAQKNGLV